MMIARLAFTLTLFSIFAVGQPTANWRTDLTKRSIELSELKSGGPGKDGIPALSHPKFEPIAGANKWLDPKEPVIVVGGPSDVRVYPVQILIGMNW